jgi:hypothetical protein
MEVIRAIAGDLERGDPITAYADFVISSRSIQPGDTALVCLHWSDHFQGGAYALRVVNDLCVKRGGVYVYRDATEISPAEVDLLVAKTRMASIARESELVVVGRVDSTREEPMWAESRHVTVEVLDIVVQQVIKGRCADTLQVHLLNRGTYNPPWRKPVLRDVSPGSTFLFLLTNHEFGLSPVMGYFGMIRVEDGGIVPYRSENPTMSLTDAVAAIRRSEER